MTLRDVYFQAKQKLRQSEDASFEAMCLFTKAFQLGKKELLLYGDRIADSKQYEVLQQMISRRLEGYPLQYLVAEWEFMGLPFTVGEGVLIPREETELLVSTALDYMKGMKEKTPRILDLCAGSGAVSVAVKHYAPQAEVSCVELSAEALPYLRKNIANNSTEVTVIHGDVLAEPLPVSQMQDMILSNPPYLTAKDMTELQIEVQWEPKMALYGGEDGLRFYRTICERWTKLLRPGGMLAVECGMGQGKAVAALFQKAGLQQVEIKYDYSNIDRVVIGYL